MLDRTVILSAPPRYLSAPQALAVFFAMTFKTWFILFASMGLAWLTGPEGATVVAGAGLLAVAVLLAGRKTLRLQAPGAVGTATQATKRLTATRDGFSLNASVACGAGERKKLERLQPHYIIVRTHTVAFHGDGYTRRAPLARRERGRGACLRRQRGVYRT